MLPDNTMKWKDGSSRAVYPTPTLACADVPLLGSRDLVSLSPYPFGLGLYVRNEDGVEVAQDMIYVSKKVAQARGRGVQPGWYVKAEPGVEFALRLTHVQVQDGGRGHVNLKPISPRFGACAEVHMDGANILGGRAAYQVFPAGAELPICGFMETETFAAGQMRGTTTLRKFRFKKIQTHENDDETNDNDDREMGSIKLKIYSGKLVTNLFQPCHRSEATINEGSVKEKSAVKLGRSLQVDKSGDRIQDSIVRTKFSVERQFMNGEVHIFMRQKYWLESRSIIDKNGNPFEPSIDKKVIDLTGGGGGNPPVIAMISHTYLNPISKDDLGKEIERKKSNIRKKSPFSLIPPPQFPFGKDPIVIEGNESKEKVVEEGANNDLNEINQERIEKKDADSESNKVNESNNDPPISSQIFSPIDDELERDRTLATTTREGEKNGVVKKPSDANDDGILFPSPLAPLGLKDTKDCESDADDITELPESMDAEIKEKKKPIADDEVKSEDELIENSPNKRRLVDANEDGNPSKKRKSDEVDSDNELVPYNPKKRKSRGTDEHGSPTKKRRDDLVDAVIDLT